MRPSKPTQTLLIVCGLVAVGVGLGLFFNPIGFERSYGIIVEDSASALSEIRAPGAALIAAGLLMISGAFVRRLTFTALVAATLGFVSYGAARVFSLIVDGRPDDGLILAAAAEITLGVASLIALVKYSKAQPNRAAVQGPLHDERYIAFTTFQRNGDPKSTPVWPVDAGDGKIGFVTSSHTWKVKRLNRNNRVLIQASDSRGRARPGSQSRSGTAAIVSGSQFEMMDAKVSQKYGFQLKIINILHALPRLVGKPGHPNDRTILITLDE